MAKSNKITIGFKLFQDSDRSLDLPRRSKATSLVTLKEREKERERDTGNKANIISSGRGLDPTFLRIISMHHFVCIGLVSLGESTTPFLEMEISKKYDNLPLTSYTVSPYWGGGNAFPTKNNYPSCTCPSPLPHPPHLGVDGAEVGKMSPSDSRVCL